MFCFIMLCVTYKVHRVLQFQHLGHFFLQKYTHYALTVIYGPSLSTLLFIPDLLLPLILSISGDKKTKAQ